MNPLAKHRTIFSIAVAIFILFAAIGAIFWARGFKPDFRNRSIERTGLLVVNSTPTGAQVYLDDRLTSATDTSIAFLDPKTYKIRIEKPGYATWEKDVEIIADLATEIKALLFPQAPEIKPLTITGATNPILSPDNTNIVYAVSGDDGGLFLQPMSDRPFPFRQSAKPLIRNNSSFDFTQSTFTWSPDSKEIIAHFEDENGNSIANILLDTEKKDQELRDISASLNATLANWQEELNQNAQTLALLAPDKVKESTGESELNQKLNYFPTGLTFSPDEEKILYKKKGGQYQIYDLKEETESTLGDFENLINISWYPDANHLVIAQENLISIIEADGTNNMTVFSGGFEDGFVFAHPSGSRLIILTTLTQPEGTPPNLYAVNLR